jgi:hypothetical protein
MVVTPKNSLEKPISLEKARRGRLHKYWPFSRALSTLGRGPRVDNALKISGPILTVVYESFSSPTSFFLLRNNIMMDDLCFVSAFLQQPHTLLTTVLPFHLI